ncbi:MAG: potassium channel family protein [Phycisphaerales bacterium]|jgi:voltage-gated potassium channel|nr:potassium channel family protein [Phycisphaerales bacterium]MDP6891512.1 potassium channel family protein [Phycisphaerales bacterium]
MSESNTSGPQPPVDDIRSSRPPSAYDLFISAAAVVAIGVLIWAWTLDRDSEIKDLLMIFDWGFCVLFFVDFLHNLFTAKRKLRYLYTWGPFDLISSIPVIGPFRLARLGAVFRILRIFRSIRILSQVYMRDKAASVVAVLMIAGIGAIIGVSVAVLHVEKRTPGASILTGEDAAWWSVVTVSTVGYGDVSPITPIGRVLAVVLMVVGIGLFATFAGAIANIFMRQVQKTASVDSLEDRLVRIERRQRDFHTAVREHMTKQNPDD